MALVPFSGEIDPANLPAGPQGPQGVPGPAGPQGKTGATGPAGGSASLTALTARVAALEAMLNGSARITHMLTLQGGIDLRYDSTPVPCAGGMAAKRPYSAFIRFSDDNPANPLGGGVHGAQVDLLDSDLFRKDPTGAYQRDVLTSTAGNQHSLTSQAPLKPV